MDYEPFVQEATDKYGSFGASVDLIARSVYFMFALVSSTQGTNKGVTHHTDFKGVSKKEIVLCPVQTRD
jgi:hypothetical protein